MVSGTTPASRAIDGDARGPIALRPEQLERGIEDPVPRRERLLLAQRRMISTFVHTLMSFQYRTV